MNRAWSAFQVGRLDEAEGLLEDVLKRVPNQSFAWVAMGMVQASRGNRDSALSSMSRALKLDPRCLPALNWSAVLSLEQGRPEEAHEFASQARSIAPNDPEAAGVLGRACLALGRPDEAIGLFDRAIASGAKDPVFRYGRAEALESLARDSEAAAEYRTALAVAANLDGYLRLAELELMLGRLDESVEASKGALGLDGTNTRAQVLLARALTESGELDEANVLWSRAEAAGAERGWVLHQRARALSTLGDFQTAVVLLEEAIEADPNQVAAYLSLVGAKQVTEDGRGLIASMEKLLEEPSLKPEDRALLHFALGKAHDQLADREAAMLNFDRANEIEFQRNPACRTFSADAVRLQTDEQIRSFERLKGQMIGVESDLPVFVLGMMRSGTTLVEQILSCHSLVAGAGELPYWLDNVSTLKVAASARKAATEYLSMLGKRFPGYPRVVDKNPANYFVAGLLHLALPNARIVHTIRDPVATALSIWMTPMRTTAPFVHNRANIVSAFREYVRLMAYWREVLPSDRFTEVRYEELVSTPEPTTRRLVEFCGVEWEEGCLHPEKKRGAIKTPSFWQARQPVYRTSLEKWRAYEPWLQEFRELQLLPDN